MPRLSIVVPVYNKDDYIDSSVKSILNQSFRDFELILVNDGSTDHSGEKCDNFSRTDSRVRVIHQSNRGVSEARNTGVKAATGSYIGFVDCDDELEIDMYETLIDTALKHDSDITICGVRKFFPHKTEFSYGTQAVIIFNKEEAIRGLLRKDFARSVYDKIFRTEIAKKVLFEGRLNEDTFYNFQTIMEAKKVVFNDVLKYNYIIREDSASMSQFSAKYFDIINFSRRMVEICETHVQSAVRDAKYFDLVNNISLLNTMVISGKNNIDKDYMLVYKNIMGYSSFISANPIKKKHRYAYVFLKINPKLYNFLMKLYCRIFDADVSKKK
ncbi:MAG TPA: glycosyltransferase [Pedobacter sp.]|nr:glycosyltransferase [Pedobacter sp.]